MYPICRIKNLTDEVLRLYAYEFQPQATYAVPDSEREGWASDDAAMAALAAGEIEIRDVNDEVVGGLAQQAAYLIGLDTHVRIVGSETNIGTQEKAFPDYTGYPYFGSGNCGGLAIAGQTTSWYLGFDKVVKIGGGGLHVGENCVLGDTVGMAMTYGVGGPVVGVFLDTLRPIPVTGGFRWERRDNRDYKDIPLGIYLRLSYTSVGETDVPTTAWFDLRRTPDA